MDKNDWILKAAVGQAFWVNNFVLPQFRLGSDGGIPDFLIVTGQSYSFEVHVVDLKLPSLRRFNKDDSISSDLNKAISQVQVYKSWIEDNLQYFKESLKSGITEKYPDFYEDFYNSRRFNVTADVIAGMRKDLNKKRMCSVRELPVRVISYERLMETENRLHEIMTQKIPFMLFNNDYWIAKKFNGYKLKSKIAKE